jgi:hypothetical protein
MHSNDIKDKFLELRANGVSLARIATDIHVSQRTLVDWNRQLALDIRALRAAPSEPSTNRPGKSSSAPFASLRFICPSGRVRPPPSSRQRPSFLVRRPLTVDYGSPRHHPPKKMKHPP